MTTIYNLLFGNDWMIGNQIQNRNNDISPYSGILKEGWLFVPLRMCLHSE